MKRCLTSFAVTNAGEANKVTKRKRVNLAIRRACEEIRCVSASFRGDVKSWAKIVKTHLKEFLYE